MFLFCITSLQLLCLPSIKAQSLTNFVDPYIGSGGHGHVFVGASVPFGAVQLGPDNFFKGWDWCSGYNYQDSVIRSFAHTHLSGTGIGDLSDIAIMPYTGDIKTDKGQEKLPGSGYASLFSHKNEKVKPGYYAVKLNNGVLVELTASERVGFHQYHFPHNRPAHVIIDLKEGINDRSTDTYIEQVDSYTFKGYRASSGWARKQIVFFAIKSSLPIKNFSVYNDSTHLEAGSGKNTAIKGLINFDEPPALLQLKVGISPVSEANALENITAEIPGWNFNAIVQQANEKWNRELGRMTIETNMVADKRIFYTAVFHSMIDPALFNDHNSDYRGADDKVYPKAAFDNYSVFSLWDTYRAANPLFVLTQPKRVAHMVNSMLAIHDQQGALPVWHLMGYETGTMVGISSEQVITEAYLKGVKGFDASRAYTALKATAMSDLRGLSYLRDFKPVPSDVKINRPVAQALELSVGDGCIALMAKALGKNDDYHYFRKRSENYKLYYDRQVGFIRGKMSDGSWNPNFDPLKSRKPYGTDFAEGNAWQYLWLTPQDVPGLIDLLGGEQTFISRLDSFFTIPLAGDLVDLTGGIGQYAHGNEPGHHTGYLYAYVGQQWKTAEKIRYILKEFYHDDPNGIIGNEDCGQMSAWYIFSSFGFYPVFTASGRYVLGSPLFPKATIHLASGKHFTVQAVNNSVGNMYIQHAELNGKKYTKAFIDHTDIMKGGQLKLFMGNRPNYQFGQAARDRPQSF